MLPSRLMCRARRTAGLEQARVSCTVAVRVPDSRYQKRLPRWARRKPKLSSACRVGRRQQVLREQHAPQVAAQGASIALEPSFLRAQRALTRLAERCVGFHSSASSTALLQRVCQLLEHLFSLRALSPFTPGQKTTSCPYSYSWPNLRGAGLSIGHLVRKVPCRGPTECRRDSARSRNSWPARARGLCF